MLLQVVAIFISLHPQYCLQPVDLEKLLSAGVQTLTGLYGITMTGYVFFLGRMDTLVQADWTISDVVDALKNRFAHMIYGISTTFLLSLFLCGLSAYLQGRAIQLPLYIHLLLLNESLLFIGTTIVVIVYYIINVVDPGNLRCAADELRKTLEPKNAGPGDTMLFFERYQKLEAHVKALLPQQLQQNPLGKMQLEYIKFKDILTPEMVQTAKELRQYHSCILHGSEIGVSQAACDKVAAFVEQVSAEKSYQRNE